MKNINIGKSDRKYKYKYYIFIYLKESARCVNVNLDVIYPCSP